jgi:hypothetical protein
VLGSRATGFLRFQPNKEIRKKKKENGIIGLVRCVKRPGEKMESHMMPVKISIAGCPSLLLGRVITLFPSHPMAFYHLLS